eukprot:CAMPEP_0180666152 /NCGR_PEP_ID=MMETSP1037_2-20121125/61662_1 /TAXON_ID=632150 /ORGANISM="Azadinium spinosum, Strain 3D9" /LENGTH=66 /DNA_ID=CAMNT_0022694641 /DNA_START=76 /DNA_END=273 /DNA_ORIENTATION=-
MSTTHMHTSHRAGCPRGNLRKMKPPWSSAVRNLMSALQRPNGGSLSKGSMQKSVTARAPWLRSLSK